MTTFPNSNLEVVKDLLINQNLSSSEIKERLKGRISPSLTHSLIKEVMRDLKRELGIQLKVKKRRNGGFTRLNDGKTLSQNHQAVGVRINNFRTIQSDLSPKEFCATYNFSNHIRIRQMEMGQYDFSLSELRRISEILNIPLGELVKPFTCYVYAT